MYQEHAPSDRPQGPIGRPYVPLGSQPTSDDPDLGDVPPVEFMVGNSAVMRDVFEQIRRFATCDAPVLITGESGTGKELVARAIHDRSTRAKEAFVAINCAAVPASLIGSELFGYEKGAFTGAQTRKRGLIEHAHRGTLFLDEIGDMPFDLQGHLLRFLQEGEVVRVGGHEPIKVDVRIIAATNVRLREAIAAGKLREDLYYRLNVLGLHVPPLRERSGDIEVLAAFFLHQITRDLAREVDSIAPAAIAAMEAYPWPGNVRELIATIRRAVVLCNTRQIQPSDLRLEPIHPYLAAEAQRPSRPAARYRRGTRTATECAAADGIQHHQDRAGTECLACHSVPHAATQQSDTAAGIRATERNRSGRHSAAGRHLITQRRPRPAARLFGQGAAIGRRCTTSTTECTRDRAPPVTSPRRTWRGGARSNRVSSRALRSLQNIPTAASR